VLTVHIIGRNDWHKNA